MTRLILGFAVLLFSGFASAESLAWTPISPAALPGYKQAVIDNISHKPFVCLGVHTTRGQSRSVQVDFNRVIGTIRRADNGWVQRDRQPVLQFFEHAKNHHDPNVTYDTTINTWSDYSQTNVLKLEFKQTVSTVRIERVNTGTVTDPVYKDVQTVEKSYVLGTCECW